MLVDGRGCMHVQVQIQQTVNIARLLGEEAVRRGVKAYVRLTQAFYDTPEKGEHDEKEGVKPSGVRGVWWHETLRVLANIERWVAICREDLRWRETDVRHRGRLT